jgi:hypothetical protein
LKASSALQALVTRTPDHEPVLEGLLCPARAREAIERIAAALTNRCFIIELVPALSIDAGPSVPL